MVRLVGVAGGTGAGKSTLCTRLMDSHPGKVGMIQLDDYFRPESDVPALHGFANWDHPDSLFLDKLVSDLESLKKEESVLINTKNLRLNPHYTVTQKRIPMRFEPEQVMLVEGFLVLWDERVRKLLDDSFFLDISHADRYARRVHFKDQGYEEKVLVPMQETFLEPTKRHAKHVLDVSDMDAESVYRTVEEALAPYLS